MGEQHPGEDAGELVDWQLARGEPLGCRVCGSLWINADDSCWHCSHAMQ